MTIEEQLRVDQTTAMKARDKDTLNAIRSVQAEVATAKSAPGFTGEIDDELYVSTSAGYDRHLSKSKAECDAVRDSVADDAAMRSLEIE